MSDSYNVDDILEELRQQKESATVPPATEAAKPAASVSTEEESEEEALLRRRRERVSNFMEHSFAAEENREAEAETDEGLVDLSEVFGRVHRRGLRTEKTEESSEAAERPAPSKKPAAKKNTAKLKSGTAAQRRFVVTLPEEEDTDEEETFDFTFEEEKEEKPQKRAFFHREKSPRQKENPEEKAEPEAAEYRSPADAAEIREDLQRTKKHLRVRLAVTGVCFLAALYLSLCNLYPLPLLTAVCPETDMKRYLLLCLLPVVVAGVVSFPVLVNGLPALLQRRAVHDTPAALCLLAVLVHTAALLAEGTLSLSEGGFYPAVACLTLLMNTVGKLTMICRIERNFAVLSSGSALEGEQLLQRRDLAAELTHIPAGEEPEVVYSSPAAFGKDFLSRSYSKDYSEEMCRTASPLFLLFGILVSLLCRLVFHQTGAEALGVLCLMLCMSSALSETLVANLPLWRAARALTPEGAFIAGYASADALGSPDAVLVDADELYPAGSAVLHGIKALRRDGIDTAILYAASLLDAAKSAARDVFLETVGGKCEILRPVEAWRYVEGGLSARIEGHEVLLGERSLLTAYNVRVPSLDLEARYGKAGRDVLYFALDGEALALFLVGYRVSRNVEFSLQRLAKKGIGLIVRTTDPHLTTARIAHDYHYPAALLRVVPVDLFGDCAALREKAEEIPADAMSIAGSRVRLRLLCALHTLQSSIRFATLLQMAGLLLGYALVAFLAFFGTASSLGFGQVLLYQVFWCAAALGIPAFMRF